MLVKFTRSCALFAHAALFFGLSQAAGQNSIDVPSEPAAIPAEYAAQAEIPVTDSVTQGMIDLASAERVAALEQRISDLEIALAEQQSVTETVMAPAPEPAPSKEDGKKMSAGWGENGFTAESANKQFKVHIGGRTQLDAVALNTDNLVLNNAGDLDSVNFRRARLRIAGTMYQTMEWAVEYDFVNGQDFDPTNGATAITPFGGDVGNVTAPTDLWWAFHEVPWVGNVRIGNMKEPIGLEHVASSRFLDFMERSFLQDAFYGPFNNGFTPGIAIYDYNEAESVTWALGGYKNTQNVFAYDVGDNEYALTGRLTGVPWSECEDRYLVHMGVGASYRGLDQDVAPATGNMRIRSRASLRNGPGPLNPNLADTNFAGRLFCDNETLIAPEIAVVAGPWFFASEYVSGFMNSTVFTPVAGAPVNLGQVYFQGSYVEALYFLTGEHRAYDRHEARFGRVVPYQNASLLPNRCGLSGWGAWQVGARYGFLDLNDAGIGGGYIQDFTLGLNWFLNPHAKLQFNYILQHVDNTLRDAAGNITAENDGELHGFGVRLAHDF